MISNYGIIYNKERNSYTNRTSGHSSENYMKTRIVLNDGSLKFPNIHRLVLGSFFPDKFIEYHDLFINHKNGIKDDNFINPYDYNDGNLEWCTPRENLLHAYKYGLQKHGEQSIHSKVTNEEVKRIIELLQLGYKFNEIQKILNNPNISLSIIYSIKAKECWRDFTKDITFKYKQPRYDIFLVNDICRTFEDFSNINISLDEKCIINLQIHNIQCTEENIRAIHRIYRRVNYTEISSQYKF